MPNTTLHTARKARDCGGYRCDETIEKGALYRRHIAFPGEEGHEEGTRPWVLEECGSCADYDGEGVRHQYGVPARFGGRVTVDGRAGVIGGFRDGLLVRFDRESALVPAHPTWRVTYEQEKVDA